MSLLAAVLLATWMGRGILLSGYPLFPSTALAMPVPWRMPTKESSNFSRRLFDRRAIRIPARIRRKCSRHGNGCRVGVNALLP